MKILKNTVIDLGKLGGKKLVFFSEGPPKDQSYLEGEIIADIPPEPEELRQEGTQSKKTQDTLAGLKENIQSSETNEKRSAALVQMEALLSAFKGKAISMNSLDKNVVRQIVNLIPNAFGSKEYSTGRYFFGKNAAEATRKILRSGNNVGRIEAVETNALENQRTIDLTGGDIYGIAKSLDNAIKAGKRPGKKVTEQFQIMARDRGILGKNGKPLAIDGDWGGNTAHALRQVMKEYDSKGGNVVGSLRRERTATKVKGNDDAKNAENYVDNTTAMREIDNKSERIRQLIEKNIDGDGIFEKVSWVQGLENLFKGEDGISDHTAEYIQSELKNGVSDQQKENIRAALVGSKIPTKEQAGFAKDAWSYLFMLPLFRVRFSGIKTGVSRVGKQSEMTNISNWLDETKGKTPYKPEQKYGQYLEDAFRGSGKNVEEMTSDGVVSQENKEKVNDAITKTLDHFYGTFGKDLQHVKNGEFLMIQRFWNKNLKEIRAQEEIMFGKDNNGNFVHSQKERYDCAQKITNALEKHLQEKDKVSATRNIEFDSEMWGNGQKIEIDVTNENSINNIIGTLRHHGLQETHIDQKIAEAIKGYNEDVKDYNESVALVRSLTGRSYKIIKTLNYHRDVIDAAAKTHTQEELLSSERTGEVNRDVSSLEQHGEDLQKYSNFNEIPNQQVSNIINSLREFFPGVTRTELAMAFNSKTDVNRKSIPNAMLLNMGVTPNSGEYLSDITNRKSSTDVLYKLKISKNIVYEGQAYDVEYDFYLRPDCGGNPMPKGMTINGKSRNIDQYSLNDDVSISNSFQLPVGIPWNMLFKSGSTSSSSNPDSIPKNISDINQGSNGASGGQNAVGLFRTT